MNIVKDLLQKGVDKKEIYQRALSNGLHSSSVAKYLAMYPDADSIKQYSKANLILVSLYGLLVGYGVFTLYFALFELGGRITIPVLAISIVIPASIIYGVYKKISFAYLILSVVLFRGMTQSFQGFEDDVMGMLLSAGIHLFLLVYSLILKLKMFPYQNFLGLKKNSEGIIIYTRNLEN